MIYLEIFWVFLKIGLFSIGGGYSILSMIQSEIVEYRQWITINEFTNLIALSQITPGPIAINSSTFVGMKVSGITGALIATVGYIFPSCIITLTLAYFYQKYKSVKTWQNVLKGMQAGAVGLIASAVLSIIILTLAADNQLDKYALILFVGGLFCIRKFKLNSIVLIFCFGIIGLIAAFIDKAILSV